MRNAAGAVVTAGVLMVAGGLFLGMKNVDYCGSAFDAPDSGATAAPASDCSARLAARNAGAWELMVVGAASVAGGAVLRRGEAADKPAPPSAGPS